MKRALAYLAIVAALLFSAAIVALLFLAPEVNPMHSPISVYALTKYAPVFALAGALVGIAGISLAIALWSLTSTLAGRIGIVLLIIWGAAAISAGVCPLDAPDTSPTLSGFIHNIAGWTMFLVSFPALLLIELTRSTLTATGTRSNTYWLAWLLLIASILLYTSIGSLASLGIFGLVQRLWWLVFVLWLLLKARQVIQAGVTSTGT